jgi:hypothetical protein
LNSDGEEDEVEDEPYDDRAWQERENSRTHSVKFTDAAEHKADDRDVSLKKKYLWTERVMNLIIIAADTICSSKYSSP